MSLPSSPLTLAPETLTPPLSLSPPREGSPIPQNQQTQPSLPATPYNVISIQSPQFRSGTFGSVFDPCNDGSAAHHMQLLVTKSSESAIKRHLIPCLDALIGAPRGFPEPNEPRLEFCPEFSVKDLHTDGGVNFGDTHFQRAHSSVIHSRGARTNPTMGVYQIDVALVASSCDFESKLIGSDSARSRRASAMSAKRRRLHESDPDLSPNGPFYCAISLVVEVKTNSPWAQYCQTLAYVLQAHERSGCRLGIAVHKTLFSRILALNARTCLVEMNDDTLLGDEISLTDLASSRLVARNLYQHNLKSSNSVGRTIVTSRAFEIFSHIVKSAATVLFRIDMGRVPRTTEISRWSQQVIDHTSTSDFVHLGFGSESTAHKADYEALVQILRKTRLMPKVPEVDIADGPDDDEGNVGGPDSRPGRSRLATSVLTNVSSANDSPTVASEMTGAHNAPVENNERIWDIDSDIEDDLTPVSLTETFRGLQAAGVKLVPVSEHIMTAAIDLYVSGIAGRNHEAELSGIKSGTNITRLDHPLSQPL